LGEEGLPFAPVIEALRGLADLDPAELETVAGPARPELGRLLPELALNGEAATGAAVAVASRAGQGRLFERLLGVVQRLATNAPLLWVLEDLHWADRSTRDLLAYLATYLRSGRVLLVGSFRSDELNRRYPLRQLLAELTATAGWCGCSCAASPAPSWPSSSPGCSPPSGPAAPSAASSSASRAPTGRTDPSRRRRSRGGADAR
jgi:hypothetical protein